MPILVPSASTAPVYYPKGAYQIVRYLDLAKFLSLLQRNTLFFCRMDYLEDHFEGTVPEANYVKRREFIEAAHKFFKKTEDKSPRDIDKAVADLYEGTKKMKSVTCVSCWNISNNESAALWKIYSDFDKGIMITSNVVRLIEAFKMTPEEVQISEVKYIDYSKDSIPEGNTNYPIIHKHLAYEYEKEFRLIHTVNFGNGFQYDWSQEETESGKNIKVDLEHLIGEIVISPYAQQWYVESIRELCNRYGLRHKPVIRSVLSPK